MPLVVDCDSHVMEPADLWQTHLEPKYRDRAIRIERREGVEHLIIGEESVLSGVLAGLTQEIRHRTELTAEHRPELRTELWKRAAGSNDQPEHLAEVHGDLPARQIV